MIHVHAEAVRNTKSAMAPTNNAIKNQNTPGCSDFLFISISTEPRFALKKLKQQDQA